ncbi:MAG TPA: hypothetical protein VGT40_15895 [Methylomirabilota bacterium]|jgi:hypothetical protein|nr:hypothetical protein [Methylomirabilota bacterium]
MIRLLAALFAAVVFVLPLLTMPARAVAVIGSLGLLFTAGAIVALRRWLGTAAACVFVAEYATAVWMGTASVHVVEAVGFGLALLFLLQAIDLACLVSGASVDATVIRAELARWIGLGVAALVTAGVALPLAGSLATTMPANIAPLLAAIGALAALLALAAVIRAGATRRSGG